MMGPVQFPNESGSDGLELPDLFYVPAVKRAGGLAALQAHGNPASPPPR